LKGDSDSRNWSVAASNHLKSKHPDVYSISQSNESKDLNTEKSNEHEDLNISLELTLDSLATDSPDTIIMEDLHRGLIITNYQCLSAK